MPSPSGDVRVLYLEQASDRLRTRAEEICGALADLGFHADIDNSDYSELERGKGVPGDAQIVYRKVDKEKEFKRVREFLQSRFSLTAQPLPRTSATPPLQILLN
jgi:hypothetical protein